MNWLTRCGIGWLVFALMLCGASACAQKGQDAQDSIFADMRERMIKTQLIQRGIKDSTVLEAFRNVERHDYVPHHMRQQAYADGPLPIGHGQTISQPYIVALMTELLQIDSTSRVLEIGTGSGYQAAILGQIADEVYTIEIVEPLGRMAKKLLGEQGYENVHVRIGDGFRGWPEEAPFDGILVTAAPDEIPEPLIEQLADGGRLVIPVGDQWQELVLVKKEGEEVTRERVTAVRFVPMTGEAQDKD